MLFGVQLLTIDGTQRDTSRFLAQTSEPARRRHLQQRALRARDRRLGRDDLAGLGERHRAGRERLTRGGTLCRGSDRREHGRASAGELPTVRAIHSAPLPKPRRRCALHATARSLARTRAVAHAFSSEGELLGDRRALVARPESGIKPRSNSCN